MTCRSLYETALAAAEAQGLGAVTYRGRMIDRANIETIHAMGLADAEPDGGR